MDSNEQIEQVAAEWIIRRASGDWTAADQVELDGWLNASMAHCAAFWRLEAAWEQSARLQALGAGAKPGVVPPRGAWQVSLFFDQRQPVEATQAETLGSSHKWKWIGLAASVLMVCGIGAYLLAGGQGDHYFTPIGGSASIPLKDGSNITLNTASDIRVVLNDRERLIRLEGGEAFFDVAKDPQRPFVVQAGNRRIMAVGTRFSVRRLGDEVQVIVTEGKVQVTDTLLAAGAIARTADAKVVVEERAPQEAEEALSWRAGYLTFNAMPLREAIDEFNRYTPRKIVVEDSVGFFHVTGRFRANNVEAFLRVIQQGFGIEAQDAENRIVLR